MSFISLARSTIPLSDFRTAGLLLSALSAGVTDQINLSKHLNSHPYKMDRNMVIEAIFCLDSRLF